MIPSPSLAGDDTRRGAALLIVLATLAVTVTACATLARIAATAGAERRFHARSIAAAELLSGADAPIQHWLDSKSAGIVLPPDSPVPEVPVLHDAWTASDDPVEFRVTAYDQCGMLSALDARSLLRSAIPPTIARTVNEAPLPRSDDIPLGLDLFAATADREAVLLFPTPTPTTPSAIGEFAPARSAFEHPPTVPAVGAWLATHNAPRIMNVNTAPRPLLESAMLAAGRGGLDSILRARARGEPSSAPPPAPGRAPRTSAPVPASSSIAWAFRVDARIGPVQRSIWSVYLRDSERWRCVQRLVIDR